MLSPAVLKIYNASAGSGKTYTLVNEYLSILLREEDPHRFKRVLAVTFTNKAAGEMKGRVLQSLKTLAEGSVRNPDNFLSRNLSKDLGLRPDQLQRRARAVLRTILHDYANFSISTIDKFTYKIIRTFTPDLGLSQNFEVEMEASPLLREAVEVLLSGLDDSEKSSRILIEFALSKLDENKSWDLSKDLMSIAGLLIEERSLLPLRKLKAHSLDDFLALCALLRFRIRKTKADFKIQADRFFDELQKANISKNSFYRSVLPNFFEKLSKGDIFKEPFKEPFNMTLEKSMNAGQLYAKGREASQKALIDALAERFIAMYWASRNAYFERIPDYLLAHLLLKNSTVLAVIHEIDQALEALKKEGDILFNAELNKLISDEIHGQPLPYIYERLGERYQHYFIDEFQDTSRLQWRNIQPLVENALAENGTALLVGDAKQSIYRWRGGEAEQFIDLIEQPPKTYRREVETLEVNFRSCEQIVWFNNALYASAAQTLDDAAHRKIYAETTAQRTIDKPGGYVELNFLDVDSAVYREQTYRQLKARVETLLERGYRRAEIAILVQKNKESAFLAQAFSRDRIAVCSSESLLLKNVWSVQLLIGLFQILSAPDDRQARASWLLLLAQDERIDVLDAFHGFISETIVLPLDAFFDKLNAYGVSFDASFWRTQSLYDLAEAAVRAFRLGEDPHTAAAQFFLDFVYRSMQKLGNSIPDFLEYWEDKKDKESVVSSENLDAIRIMTIHKSKGLQFPVALLAFADWPAFEEKNSTAWLDIDPKTFNGFDISYVTIKPFMQRIGGAAKALYEDHSAKFRFDSLNLLYVATTRAIEQLIVFAREKKNKNETISFYLEHYLHQEKLWEDNQRQYSFGTPEKCVHSGDEPLLERQEIAWVSEPWQRRAPIKPIFTDIWKETRTAARSSGDLVHKALSMIRTASDLEPTLRRLSVEGRLSDQERPDLEKRLLAVIDHPELRGCYQSERHAFSERELLFRGKLLRPDRVVFFPEETVVIDYKTGAVLEAHRRQLDTYVQALSSMGYLSVKGLLVYIADEVKIVQINSFG